MATAKHLYIDPETFEVYVEPGDDLTPEIVEALRNIGAIRINAQTGEPELQAADRNEETCSS